MYAPTSIQDQRSLWSNHPVAIPSIPVDAGETRVAVLESENGRANNGGRAKQTNGEWRIGELYVERRGRRSIVGNIYKG
ncbi:MAG: hypothetical protein ABGY41_05530, partial [Candidatus Poribacteria bacterium]